MRETSVVVDGAVAGRPGTWMVLVVVVDVAAGAGSRLAQAVTRNRAIPARTPRKVGFIA